jgi:hypothetical protein
VSDDDDFIGFDPAKPGSDRTVVTVGEDFPREQARVRLCLERGIKLGSAGVFYVHVCRQALERADKAMASGDVIEIVRAYKEMQEIAE